MFACSTDKHTVISRLHLRHSIASLSTTRYRWAAEAWANKRLVGFPVEKFKIRSVVLGSDGRQGFHMARGFPSKREQLHATM